jgi:hypothetical protein
LFSIIKNIEDFMVVPMLYKARVILDTALPQSLPEVASGDSQLVPREVLGRPVMFRMIGASRFAERSELLQLLQPVSQALLSEPVLMMARQQSRTMDFGEWERFFLDATTGSRYGFFRDMTEEEFQMAQQPDPETQAQIQAQQQAEQTRREIAAGKDQTVLQKAQIEAQADREVAAEQVAARLLETFSKAEIEKIKARLSQGRENGGE